MPRTKTLTCYICDEPMWAGRSTKPQGEAAHNKCRTEAHKIYTHGATGYRRGCRCQDCKAGQARYIRAYVDSVRAQHGLHPNTVRRKKFKEEHGYWPQVGSSSWIAPRLRHEIYERDDWTCKICHNAVDMDADRNSNYAPSLDHIVPQSHMLIPDHSPSNLRTAHRLCNSRRGTSVDARWINVEA